MRSEDVNSLMFKRAGVLLFCVLLAGPVRAEVLDRIVGIVDGHIITLSDVHREREIRADIGEKSNDNDSTIAKQLIDNYLVEQEITSYPTIEVTDAEINAAVASGASNAVRDAVRRKIRMQKFMDAKFRQLLRPTDDQIRKYYDEIFAPEARARGLQSIPPLTDPEMANAIRNNVIQEMLDHEVDVWLEAIRQRSKIEVFQ